MKVALGLYKPEKIVINCSKSIIHGCYLEEYLKASIAYIKDRIMHDGFMTLSDIKREIGVSTEAEDFATVLEIDEYEFNQIGPFVLIQKR